MQPVQLFSLASEQAHWLSVRQTVVAGNIANANTPGYAAKDVEPFEKVLETAGNRMERAASRMAATHPAHFSEDSIRNSVRSETVGNGVEVQASGNSVTMTDELIKAGEIKREMQLNTSLVKSFHRMMLMTVRP